MKKLFALLASGMLAGVAFADSTLPVESKNDANVETEVDVDKNIFTGSKTVKTTKEYESESDPGVKVKRYSKNVKKYDKDGNLIKDETEIDNSAKKND